MGLSPQENEARSIKQYGLGLWFGSLGPADIAGPTVLIRTVHAVNLRTAYFLEKKRKPEFILQKVYALLHKSMINCLMLLKHSRGDR